MGLPLPGRRGEDVETLRKNDKTRGGPLDPPRVCSESPWSPLDRTGFVISSPLGGELSVCRHGRSPVLSDESGSRNGPILGCLSQLSAATEDGSSGGRIGTDSGCLSGSFDPSPPTRVSSAPGGFVGRSRKPSGGRPSSPRRRPDGGRTLDLLLLPGSPRGGEVLSLLPLKRSPESPRVRRLLKFSKSRLTGLGSPGPLSESPAPRTPIETSLIIVCLWRIIEIIPTYKKIQ